MTKDAQLFAAAQAGDTAAFGELVKRYEALVGAVAIASMRQSAHVEDVVQETFVAAWLRRDSLQDPEKFRAWICGIARNQAAKVERRESRSIEASEPQSAPSAEEELLQAESSRTLSAALEALHEDHREVLVLFYREEQSIREVASALQLSESAAQKRISRARDSIKSEMTSLLGKALPATRIRAGVSAAVLATITASAAPAAASSASTTTLTKGIFTMKIAAALTTVAALAGGFVAYSYLSQDEQAHASGSAVPGSAAAPSPSTNPASVTPQSASKQPTSPIAIQMRRLSQAERARRFALHKKSLAAAKPTSAAATKASSTTQPPPSNRSDRDIIKATIATVRPLIVECYELAQLNDPTLAGMIAVRFHISDEPDIFGLVTDAEVSRRRGGFDPANPEFEECLQETMMSLEFIGISKGLAITYPFVFRQSDEAEQAERMSTEKLSAKIVAVSDAQELVYLAEEYRKSNPDLAIKACDKAIGNEDSIAHRYRCTLVACELKREDQALAFWSKLSNLEFGKTLLGRATNHCAASGISLPPPSP